jgi:6,7-dimethyl-8-ribityllumazine synthase
MLDSQTPIGFGLLTVDNEQQALDRSRENKDNKGIESTLAALKMAIDFK